MPGKKQKPEDRKSAMPSTTPSAPNKSVQGESRRVPLEDVVLGVLSLAAQNGQTRVRIRRFYDAFGDLLEEYPQFFTGIDFARTQDYAYSKSLDSALQHWIGYGLELPNPQLQYVETDPELVADHLAWLRDEYGQEFIDELTPMAERFAISARKPEDP